MRGEGGQAETIMQGMNVKMKLGFSPWSCELYQEFDGPFHGGCDMRSGSRNQPAQRKSDKPTAQALCGITQNFGPIQSLVNRCLSSQVRGGAACACGHFASAIYRKRTKS